MKKQHSKNRAGITLIEIIFGLAAASIVILATSTVLIFGERSLDHGWLQANLQRDASYAMLIIKRSIAEATKAELEEDNGPVLKIYNSSGWIKYKFFPNQKDLRWQVDGEDDHVILEGVVESVTFTIDSTTNNAVTVWLELKEGDCQAQTSSTVMMRNYGS